MALAGVAVADTYTSSTYKKQDQAAPHYGFTLAIADSNWVDSTIPTDVTSVQLDSITILTRQANDKVYSDIKIAVYEYLEDSNVGTFLGFSSSESFTAETNVEFTFSDSITLNPTTRYQFMFVASDSTAESVDTYDEYKTKATQWGLALTNKEGVNVEGEYTYSNIPGGWGTYTNGTVNGWQGSYLPVVTIKTSTLPVPEPATATLSLLALAGLAARRRRK